MKPKAVHGNYITRRDALEIVEAVIAVEEFCEWKKLSLQRPPLSGELYLCETACGVEGSLLGVDARGFIRYCFHCGKKIKATEA